MPIYTHIFRFVLLIAIGIIFLFFTEIDRKLELMIGWIIGAILAYIIGLIILHYRKGRKNKKN